MTTTPNDLPIAVRHVIVTTIYDEGHDSRTPEGYADPLPFDYVTACGLRWTRELPQPIATDDPRTCKTCAENAVEGTAYTVVGHTAADLENLPTTNEK